MTSSHLTLAVDTWVCQAVVASRHLMRLYRALGDPKQASNAIQSGTPSEERAQRLGLALRISELQANFVAPHPEDVSGEAHAWQTLVEAQAGLCAFHAMANGQSDKAKGLQGARNAATKSFHRSLQGYRVAFPEPMANEGISMAIRAASTTCTDTFIQDLIGDADHEVPSGAALEIHRNTLEALLSEANLKPER